MKIKLILLFVIFIVPAIQIYSQSREAEIQSIDSLFKEGKLRTDQVVQLRSKCFNLLKSDPFPELKVNNKTGEIEISDTLIFTNTEKKVIFQRCMQWIAINYGYLVYSDLESGKIIATGLLDLPHFTEYRDGFTSPVITKVLASTSYTMILTLKDNKIKYTITNINYTFTNYSETIDQISFPIASIYPVPSKDQTLWIRYISVLNASTDKFYFKLKNYLADYVSDAENDYKF